MTCAHDGCVVAIILGPSHRRKFIKTQVDTMNRYDSVVVQGLHRIVIAPANGEQWMWPTETAEHRCNSRTSRHSLLIRESDSWSKGCEFESRQERRDNFLLQGYHCELTLIQCPFHFRVTTVACKRPQSLNTHTSLTQRSRSGLIMPLSRHSVGAYPETKSHATCQGTFGHSRLSSLSHCGLIPA